MPAKQRPQPPFAHSAPEPRNWEPYAEHRDLVARYAGDFSAAFNARAWGETLGRWHDLGKLSAEWQAYLEKFRDPDAGEEDAPNKPPGRVDHSTFGARHAATTLPGPMGQLFAHCIAGHHGGLLDGTADDESTTLKHRLDPASYTRCKPVVVPDEDRARPKLVEPFPLAKLDATAAFPIAFLTRMLFSCLVDADRTATEQFCDPAAFAERTREKPTVVALRDALDGFLNDLSRHATPTPVNAVRADVLADCRAAASQSTGFFSLDVPTGGGKTYASLAFALRHAVANNLRRVIVAIPFTSIIEQTADNYRRALGPLAGLGLIEHHSNIEELKQTRANRIAAENWDAPLIVTTNVQLYESLFASHTTPCRKLHRIARSVIVLDEAQTVPVELLAPTLRALRELVEHYGCTIVLCTATQPALDRRDREFEIGLPVPTPIIGNDRTLHTRLKRVDVTRLGKLDDAALVDRLAAEASVLCIVNTRPHAAKLFDALVAARGEDGCFHLSTFMCAQHRRDVLATIRDRLKKRLPCRVISTQLIEAGVDVDFPCVYRAQAGFDSIAQAAGRCNREGKLCDADGNLIRGKVFVFDAEKLPPAGLLRAAAETARELAPTHADPLLPTAIEAYFRQLYWNQKVSWDKFKVLDALSDDFINVRESRLKFREAARQYKIIREEGEPILVPYNDEARAMLDMLNRDAQADYAFLRSAQKYIVSVREEILRKLFDLAVIAPHESGVWRLMNEDCYSLNKGLSATASGFAARR